jgi:hypothetical protein
MFENLLVADCLFGCPEMKLPRFVRFFRGLFPRLILLFRGLFVVVIVAAIAAFPSPRHRGEDTVRVVGPRSANGLFSVPVEPAILDSISAVDQAAFMAMLDYLEIA